MPKHKNSFAPTYLSFFIFLLIVLAVWIGLAAMPHPQRVDLPEFVNVLDIPKEGLDDTVYQSHKSNWLSWPEDLHSPAEIATRALDNIAIPAEEMNYTSTQYATHQLTLRLPLGQSYGISCVSSDYSMRFFIANEEAGLVGLPADNAEDTIPRTAECVFYFTPTETQTTITVQVANFVHKDGLHPPVLTIGSAAAIAQKEKNDAFTSAIVVGCLLTSGLYHMGLFIANRRQKHALVFSGCCFFLMLLTHKLIPLFFLQYNWHIAFRLEYIVHVLTFAGLTLLLETLFPQLFHRWVVRCYYAIGGVLLLCVLVLPSKVFSGLLLYFHIASIAMILYILTCLALALREKKLQNALALIGVSVICLFGVNDILYINGISFIGRFMGQLKTTPVGMMFFVFCYCLVVNITFTETEQKMKEAHQQIAKIEARYAFLEKEQKNAKSPQDILMSFGLSKREMEVAWLLLDGKSRMDIAAVLSISLGSVNTYCTRIYKKSGVANIAALFKAVGTSAKGPPE